MSAVIDHNVHARLITRASSPSPLTAELRYSPADPLAVQVRFPPESSLDGVEVVWTFARDLLAAGVRTLAGEGDVQVWPAGPAHTMLELHGSEGVALIQLDTGTLRRFLRAAYGCVPKGREQSGVRLDRGLTELLRGV